MSSGTFPDSWHFIVEIPQKDDHRTFEYSWDGDVDKSLDLSGDVYELEEPVNFKVKVSRTVLGVEIKVNLSSKIFTKCVRCLSPLELAIEEDFGYCYVLRSEENETESDYSDPGDFVVVKLERFDKILDITRELWECFVMSLPRYPSCSDECELIGPLSTVKEGEASDPRFQILADNIGSFTDKGGNSDGDTKK